MTIEQLLDCNAEKLKSFTDEQLNEWFTPDFPTTRPELARQLKKESPTHNSKPITMKNIPSDPAKRAAKLQAMEIAAQYGIKLKL